LLTFSPQEFLDFSSMVGEFCGAASLELLKERNGCNYYELDLVA
jgi:hypothetical protein